MPSINIRTISHLSHIDNLDELDETINAPTTSRLRSATPVTKETNLDITNTALTYFNESGVTRGDCIKLKPGKEATVFIYPETGTVVKIYKNIEERSFKNTADYMTGRLQGIGLNRRDCMHLLSHPDELLAFWIESEFILLERLFTAGLAVPRPLEKGPQSIAMECIGGSTAAPRLQEYSTTREEAAYFKKKLLSAIEQMLSLNVVHGDLSPYNILVHDGKPWIIDFPQAIDPRFTPSARNLLERDIFNCSAWCTSSNAEREARSLADELWNRYIRGALS